MSSRKSSRSSSAREAWASPAAAGNKPKGPQPVKKLMSLCAVVLALFGMFASGCQSMKPLAEQPFVFKYEPGESSSYAMSMKVGLGMDMEVGEENTKMDMAFEMRYNMKLTPVADPKDGIATLRMEPSNVEGDWDMDLPNGHMMITLRNGKMKGTLDGEVIIDTEHGIGEASAQEIKKEIFALFLSGRVDIDASGRIKKFDGDLSFVEFWTEATAAQLGLLGIVFPEKPIPAGSSWQESLCLKKMNAVKFDGDGLVSLLTFTRQPDEEIQGRSLAVFSLSAPLSKSGVFGTMEQNGPATKFNITKLDRNGIGKFYFDQVKGTLVDANMKADGKIQMNTTVGRKEMTMVCKVNMEMKAKQLPGQ